VGAGACLRPVQEFADIGVCGALLEPYTDVNDDDLSCPRLGVVLGGGLNVRAFSSLYLLADLA
jgi:hypothetical protein